jgi:hypothetical protein
MSNRVQSMNAPSLKQNSSLNTTTW